MPELWNKVRGRMEFVPNELIDAARASNEFDFGEETQVAVTTPSGRVVTGSAKEAEAVGALGVRPAAEEDIAQAEERAYLEKKHGGFVGGATAVGLGILRGGSLGLTDVLAGTEPGRAKEIREIREVHPGKSAIAEIGSAIVPSLVSGGAGAGAGVARLTPTVGAQAAGRAVTRRLGGGLGAKVAGEVVEGAAVAGGFKAGELSLSENDHTVEQIFSELSSSLLLGGVLSGGGTLAGKAAEKTIERGSRAAKAYGERLRTGQAARDVSEDLTQMDVKQLRTAEKETTEAIQAERVTQKAGLRKAKEAEITRIEEERALSKQSLRTGREVELEAIEAEQVTHRARVGDSVGGYRDSFDEAQPWLVVDDNGAAVLNAQKKAYRRALDEPIGLRRDPRRMGDPLRREAEVYRRTMAKSKEIAEGLRKEERGIAKAIQKELGANEAEILIKGKAARRYGDWSSTKIPRKVANKGVKLSAEEAQRFVAAIRSGETAGERLRALQRIPKLLDENLALQKQIDQIDAAMKRPSSAKLAEIDDTLAALSSAGRPTSDTLTEIQHQMDALATAGKPTSQRLTEIQTAIDALQAGGKKSLAEQLMQGAAFTAVTGAVAPMLPDSMRGAAPIFGAVAARRLSGGLFGRLGKVSTEASARTARAMETFLNVSKRAAKVAPPMATRVLASVRFAPEQAKPGKPEPAPKNRPRESALATAYKAREREVLSQVEVEGPTGKLVMTQEARAQVAERLAGIRMEDPRLADKLETMAARKLEYVANVLPKRPDMGAMQIGPVNYQQSELKMREVARIIAALEDPGSVEERLADGTVTPEEADAYREVYPERFEAFKRDVILNLPTLRETLPYERKLALSIFTGVAVEPALTPSVLRVLQGMFAEEEGTEGGTQPPMAEPNFGPMGSLKAEEPTAAQKRAG